MRPGARTETAASAERGRSLERGVWSPFRALLSAQTIATALGFAFWVLVARIVDAHQLGVAAAAISAQTLLGLLTPLGLGTMLISELPLHPAARQRRLVLRSLLVVLVFSTLVGGAVVAASPLLPGSLHEALTNPVGATAFVLGVAAAGWSIVIDECCLGLRRARVQVGRNLLAAGLRFPMTVVLLLAFGLTESQVLQLCWVLPLLVSVGVALWQLRLPKGDTTSPPLRADMQTYVGLALRNHTLSLALAGASQMVPVVAGLTLASVDNAEFAIAWLIATFVFLPPYLLATALFAHGANISTEEFRRSMERTLPAGLLLSAALCLGAWVLGGPVLRIFGGGYAAESWQILALLVPGGLWMVFKDHLVTLWRSQRRFKLATRLATAALVLEVAGATIGALVAGATGLCVGWLCAMGLEVVLSTPWLRQALGGLHWRWPVPVRRRAEAGRVAPHVLAAAAVVLLVGIVGVWSATHGSDDGSDPSANPTAPGLPSAETCAKNSDGPVMVDLGVQASRGDRTPPLLTEAAVNGLVGRAQRAGASIISTSASFAVMQPHAGEPYRFEGMDRVISAARAAGLKVTLRMVGMPAWALDEIVDGRRQPPRSDTELGQWATFVRTVMTHVQGGVDYVQVWNEPNAPKYWPTGPDPVEFVRLLDVTHDVVKEVSPSTKVVSGGLRGNDIGYLDAMYEAVDTLGKKELPVDLVGVEPFNAGAAPDVVDPGERFEQEPFGLVDGNFLGFVAIHDAMAEHGDSSVPLYLTLFGYSTEAQRYSTHVTDATRATYLGKALDEASCYGYIEAFGWYAFHPNPWDPPSWTLLDENNEPNRTYAALRKWSHRTSGD
jgi:O-antigen/teichoic acid export membrane protein